MKHLKKTILTLVALLAVTTGAWAGIALGDVYKFGSQITFDGSTVVWFKVFSGGAETITTGIHTTQTLTYGGYNSGKHTLTFPSGDGASFMYIVDDNPAEPWGIQVSSGQGTVGNPFVLTAIYDAPLIYHNSSDDAWFVNMPAGNVTVSVDYYPKAQFAMSTDERPWALVPSPTDAIIFATTDQPLVGPGTVANIPGSTDGKKQGTVMFYVGTTDNLTEAQLIALVNEGKWSSDVPTAADIEEACTVYVYYYIKGNDGDTDETTFSDGDFCDFPIWVEIKGAPTYNVEFAEGVNPEPPADPIWTATPNTGVKKGDKVTVTYTGERKVIGVKAEKKTKVYTMAADATAEDKGKLICADGHIHAYNEDAECTAARVAKIIYLGTTGHATYTHGLALALEDVSSNSLSWDNSRSNNNSMTAAEWCSGCNTSKAVTGATWLLASKDQWDYMLGANGAGSYTALRDGFTSVGGTNMQSVGYWSSTEDSSNAWIYGFGSGSWYSGSKDSNYNVRACIAF